jgi:ferric-dicitrate binding protein FerR (iron transport regulator)
MNKKVDKLIFEKYLNGACSPQEVEQLLHWIASSEENQKALFNLKILRGKEAYAQFSDEAHLEKAYRQLLRMLEKRQAVPPAGHISLRTFIRYAASVLLILGLSFAAYFIYRANENPYLTVQIAPGEEIKTLTLDDQSRIWLSPGSQIRYPARFAKGKRSVELEGKAYFEVARDTCRPFTVHTGEYAVEVLGTAFEIRSFNHENTSDVILEEGSVCLSDNDGKALCRLRPGQIFEYDNRKKDFSINEIDAGLYTSWRKGVIEFDRITFEELIAVLARNYQVKISIQSRNLENYTLVSSLSLTKNIREMMETLQYIVPMKYTFENDSIISIKAKK